MATPTMGQSSVDRLARSKRPTVERAEIHIPPAPVFPLEAVTGDPARRAQAVAAFNNALQKWRNDAWSIEAPFVPDAALQADVATLQDTTAKVATKLDRAAVDIRRTEANVTTIQTNITNIDNSITEINNEITNINNAITGTGIVQANGAAPPSAILGTPGYFPYWSASNPFLKPTSTIFTTGTFTGVGLNTGLVAPVTPDAPLHVWVHDFTTSTVTDVLKIYHGVATNLGTFLGIGGGTGFLLSGASDSVINRQMGRIQTRWNVAADAMRASAMDFQTATAGGTLSTKVTILESGFVGIGTTAPGALLDLGLAGTVLGVLRLAGSTSGNVTIQPAVTAGTWTLTLPANDGNLGDMLVTDGVGITSWTAPATVTPAALTRVDDANITLTLGGSPTVALLAATSLTLGWTGELSLARGGTNKGMVASAGSVAFSDVDSLELTAVGTVGQVLTSQGAGTPTWTTPASLSTPVAIAEGGTNNTAFNTNSVIFYDGTRLTDDGAAFTYAAAGDNQLLIAKTLGNVQNDNVGYYALNSSGALAGAANQQWSPSFLWEGQGWGGSSQAVKYRAYVVPVDAATNPTGYWILERQIAALGYVELLRADSTGYLRITKDDLRSIDTTLAQSVFGLHLTNNTTSTGAITTQDAPPIIFKGQARNTTANTSHDWRWRMLMKGVTNAGTTRSYLRIDSGADASNFGNPIVMSSAGGLSVGALIEAAFGVVSAQVGYQIAGAATSGHALISNGTNFISQALTSTLVTYAFTAGSVIFAGAGGTTLAQDNANLFYDDTNNRLGIGINTFSTLNESLHVYNAAALTATRGLAYIENDATSATVGINKVGLQVESMGNWTGAGSAVYGIFSRANDGAGGSTRVSGLFGWAEGGAIEVIGVSALATVTVAGVTSSIGVLATSSNSTAPARAIGGFFSATGGTLNYALIGGGGKIWNDSTDSIVCSNAALATNATAGFLYIPTCAGTPTGAPDAETGTAALVFDTANDILYIYRGGWKGVVVV